MTDLTHSIEARSDQLNADDLLAGPITVKITKVSAGTAEQPIAINYEGDNGKPYYACKSMRRVLVAAWGADGAQFVGRAMTLYRDPAVMFGGIQVGGIRISHLSHIDRDLTMALTAKRGSKKPFQVKPLPFPTSARTAAHEAPHRRPGTEAISLEQRTNAAIDKLRHTPADAETCAKAERACEGLLRELDEAGETDLHAALMAELVDLRSAVETNETAARGSHNA